MAYDDHIGRSERREDRVHPLLLRGLSASLDVPEPADGVLPPLWHWTLFQDWAPAHGLGPDGHPRRGGFMPPVHDLPRRMWAGGRIQFPGTLRASDPVTRDSTILTVMEKQGGSGRLVFVTVRHVIAGPAGPAIIEEQDVVYRSAEGAPVRAADPAPPAPAGAVRQTVRGDPVLLFRYSALTGNGHRIHYDADYVRDVEGYPGLVVHGPLQATWLAGLAARGWPGRRIARFSFRGQRPAFHTGALALEGWQEGGTLRLRTLDPDGLACMAAEAVLEP